MRIYIWFPVITSMGLGFIFMNIPPLAHQFMELMDIGYDGLAILLSGLILTHALLQLPSGMIVDRFNPKTVLAVGLVLCILGNLLPLIKPESLALATFFRTITGVGTSISFLAMMKVIIFLAPPHIVPAIQGYQGAGFSLGFALPYLILPKIGGGQWYWCYLFSAILQLIPLICILFLPSLENASSTFSALSSKPQEKKAVPWDEVKKIVKSKDIYFLGVFHGLSYGSMNNFGNWVPSIMADLDGKGDAEAWGNWTMVLLLLGCLGRVFSGKFAAIFQRGKIVNFSILLIAIFYLLSGVSSNHYLVLAAILLMVLACGSNYGSIFSLSAAAGGIYAATAMGVMNMIGNLFNIVLTLLFGYVRQYTGHFTLGLISAGIVAILFWVFGRSLIIELEERSKR